VATDIIASADLIASARGVSYHGTVRPRDGLPTAIREIYIIAVISESINLTAFVFKKIFYFIIAVIVGRLPRDGFWDGAGYHQDAQHQGQQ